MILESKQLLNVTTKVVLNLKKEMLSLKLQKIKATYRQTNLRKILFIEECRS